MTTLESEELNLDYKFLFFFCLLATLCITPYALCSWCYINSAKNCSASLFFHILLHPQLLCSSCATPFTLHLTHNLPSMCAKGQTSAVPLLSEVGKCRRSSCRSYVIAGARFAEQKIEVQKCTSRAKTM